MLEFWQMRIIEIKKRKEHWYGNCSGQQADGGAFFQEYFKETPDVRGKAEGNSRKL
jgi:hypothetical protein